MWAKFKKFMGKAASAVFNAPGAIVNGLFTLVLGEQDTTDVNGNVTQKGFRGLAGFAINVFKFVSDALGDLARAMTNSVTAFIGNHKKAISVAAWTSLAVAGIAALVVGLWPAALAVVAGVSISGVSIASLVGTGFAAQVAAVAGVGAVLASAVVYTVATVSNIVGWIKGCFATTKKEDRAETSVPSRVATPKSDSDDNIDMAASKATPSVDVLIAPEPVRPSAKSAANDEEHQAPGFYPTLPGTGLASAGVGLRVQSVTPVRDEERKTPTL